MVEHGVSRLQLSKLPIYGCVDLALVPSPSGDKYYVVDGQHRVQAIKNLAALGYKIPLFSMIYRVSNIEEAERIFLLRNTINPLPQIYLENRVTPLDKEIEIYLSNREGFSSTVQKRPKTNISEFLNRFNNSQHKIRVTSLEIFVQFLNYFSEQNKSKLTNPLVRKKWDVRDYTYSKFVEWNLFIAADPSYSWIYE